MSDTIRLEGTTLNAPDALALARFYAEITGGTASGTTHWRKSGKRLLKGSRRQSANSPLRSNGRSLQIKALP